MLQRSAIAAALLAALPVCAQQPALPSVREIADRMVAQARRVEEGKLLVFISDVTGHGVPAAGYGSPVSVSLQSMRASGRSL